MRMKMKNLFDTQTSTPTYILVLSKQNLWK